MMMENCRADAGSISLVWGPGGVSLEDVAVELTVFDGFVDAQVIAVWFALEA